jgi:SAM-dependent methyltransferase
MTDDPAAIVRRGYDEIGAAYHEWSSAAPLRIAYVQRLLDRLPERARVIELGCGPGDPATRMLASGHTVVAVELSAGQLALAKRHAPNAALVQADMTRLSVRPGSVDAIASFFALGHLPEAAHRPLLASFGTWLKPGGVLVTNAPMSPGDGVEDGWLGVPMFFGGIGPEATLAALEQGGLVVESAEAILEDEGEDRTATFLWVVAHKPEEAR